jgi:hypothetical protein
VFMKFTKFSFVVLFVLCCALLFPGVVSAAPVYNSANGHYYEGICTGSITWSDANSAAQGISYRGSTGHLVTITDSAENTFVFDMVKDQSCLWWLWGGSWPVGPWLGASDSQNEGEWKWVTGEPVVYSNWYPGEPNDGYFDEDFMALADNYLWFDAGPGNGMTPTLLMKGYVVEYEPPFDELPAPEFPSTFLPVTMIIGFLGAVLLIQRTREH